MEDIITTLIDAISTGLENYNSFRTLKEEAQSLRNVLYAVRNLLLDLEQLPEGMLQNGSLVKSLDMFKTVVQKGNDILAKCSDKKRQRNALEFRENNFLQIISATADIDKALSLINSVDIDIIQGRLKMDLQFALELHRTLQQTIRSHKRNTEVERLLTCPITQDIVMDPVLLIAGDEAPQMYDREAALKWLNVNPNREPKTGIEYEDSLRIVGSYRDRELLKLYYGEKAHVAYDQCAKYYDILACLYGMNQKTINYAEALLLVESDTEDAVLVAFHSLLLSPFVFETKTIRKDEYQSYLLWDRAMSLGLVPTAENGNAVAQTILGICFAANGPRPNSVKANEWLYKAARVGSPDAQYRLGRSLADTDNEKRIWLQKAAEQGHAGAQFRIGLHSYRGTAGFDPDAHQAFLWFEKAALQGHVSSQFNVGIAYERGTGVPQDFASAMKWYNRAADQGDCRAQCKLGLLYENGKVGARDFEKAVQWWRWAASRGSAEAQYHLGRMYLDGHGVPKDLKKAAECLTKAGHKDHHDAQYRLGTMYKNGDGVPVDPMMAFTWHYAAAKNGHADAQYSVAFMFEEGLGVPQDDSSAIDFYRKAADQGSGVAQLNLGKMYYDGRGVDSCNIIAVEWFRKAAANGQAEAQCHLAFMYEHGLGVPANVSIAMKLYRRSAALGTALASSRLGDIYAEGHSVPKDTQAAIDWYRKAAAQGNSCASEQLNKLNGDAMNM